MMRCALLVGARVFALRNNHDVGGVAIVANEQSGVVELVKTMAQVIRYHEL